MKICELFTSIQGESSYAGSPCTFVRLSGCNLRCVYCDTQYSYTGGADMSVDEVVGYVESAGVDLVEITGGEPLLQAGEVRVLTKELLDRGFRVLIETNGSLSIRDIDDRAVVVLDVKTPGSGVSGRTDTANFGLLKPLDEVKFVICSREDYDWSKALIARHIMWEKCSVLFSAAQGLLEPSQLAGWVIADRLRVRLNVQIHKYIFGDKRGV